MYLTAKSYALAGDATFTIESKVTKNRYTYRVKECEKSNKIFWVYVLTGPNNQQDYEYLGYISKYKGFVFQWERSNMREHQTCVKAFQWFWKYVDWPLTQHLEFYPSIKCCACGRQLTTPDSIEAGIGPECRKNHG